MYLGILVILIQVRCSISALVNRKPEGHLFSQLLTRLKLYSRFEINDQTGSALTDHEMTDLHYNRITSLQVCYRDKYSLTIVIYSSHLFCSPLLSLLSLSSELPSNCSQI